jgi:putative cardiolipin synthase
VADCKRLFVGSFNLDPRSASLNTEMGVVIDSPKLANELSSQLDTRLPNAAYLVRLTPEGQIEWLERGIDGHDTRYTTEPRTSGMRRLWVDFLEMLPIESLL